jgi:tetratricopeptide (TPR) repeat protein
LQGTGISLNLVRNALSVAKLSLIILDACRSIGNVPAKGPLEGLAAFMSRGALIAFAADEGQSASDNDSEDVSLFTKYLVSELEKRDEALCPLFTAIRAAVDEASGHAQFPFVYDGVIGDFIFNRTTTAESRNLAIVGKSKAWTSIQSSNNPNDFAAYLAPYFPDKKYAKVAEGRLSSLMSATAKGVGVVPFDTQAPPEAVAIANQGARLFYERSYDQALKTYEKAIISRPADAFALYDYATCLLYLGKYDEAIKFFSKSADLNHELVWAYFNRGVAKHLKGNLQEAISDYTVALQLRPNNALGFNNLALAQRQKGDLNGAEVSVEKAINLDPNYPPAYFNKATIRVELGDVSSATGYVAKGKSLTVPKL